jgi:hypothetical protein
MAAELKQAVNLFKVNKESTYASAAADGGAAKSTGNGKKAKEEVKATVKV